MLSSLFRPKRPRQQLHEAIPSSPGTAQSSPAKARQERMQSRYASADFTATEDDDDDDDTEEEDVTERGERDRQEDEVDEEADEEENEDEDGVEETHLLPIFSEAHLG